MDKKVLVISNEAFNYSSSNGRTIMNLLKNIKKENLAQFYIHGEKDNDFCVNYYQNSDKDALNAFLLKRKTKNSSYAIKNNKEKKIIPKTYRNCVLRNIIWQSLCWWGGEFEKFLCGFKPNIILLQAGDAPFLFKIARRIAKKYSAKLIMLNTESYVLKEKMYETVKKQAFWHFFLMASLKKQYKKFMREVDFCIYSLEALEQAYQERYPHPQKSCTLYTISEMENLPDYSTDTFTLLYCGNLGVGRDEPLNQVAKALAEIDERARLEIYGVFKSDSAKDKLCSNPNVIYHGFVDYHQIPRIMSSASMLLHCENNSGLIDLKYAFSTKIADSLSSGRPFLVYATKEYPFAQYLLKNQCSHIAENYEELKMILKKCIEDRNYLYKFVDNAKAVAYKNHNKERNCQKVSEIISSL